MRRVFKQRADEERYKKYAMELCGNVLRLPQINEKMSSLRARMPYTQQSKRGKMNFLFRFPCENYLHRYKRLMMMMSIYRKIYGYHFSCITYGYNVIILTLNWHMSYACPCYCLRFQQKKKKKEKTHRLRSPDSPSSTTVYFACVNFMVAGDIRINFYRFGYDKTAASFSTANHTVNQ